MGKRPNPSLTIIGTALSESSLPKKRITDGDGADVQ